MAIYATQRRFDNNQSTVDYLVQNIFTYENRFNSGVFINNLGESIDAQDGILVVRNSGTFENAVVKFNQNGLTAGQTVIIAGLTFTSTGVSTATQVAAAFANGPVGLAIGAGSTYGTYSGSLTGYSSGPVYNGNTVTFTASTVGDKSDLVVGLGTGASPNVTVINGALGVDEGFSPATISNLANVIGILKTSDIGGVTTMVNGASMNANYALSGDIDAGMLFLPQGVTLDTIVGSKALKDVLTAIGFVLNNVTEMTKFDN